MRCIVQVANDQAAESLSRYGEIVYKLESMDVVIIDIYDSTSLRKIKKLPGVLSVNEESVGDLAV